MTQYSTEWSVVGHTWAIEHLVQSLAHARTRHAYLISGPAGIGKTTLARSFARALNCLSDESRPCGVCRACTMIAADIYPDVSIIEADGGTMKIEQIRELQHMLALRPVEGRYRVIILRRFDQATPQAMDSLLKTLEEPPPYVILLLTADTTDSLLSTIRSRCQPVSLRPLPASLIRTALQTYFEIDPETAALMAQLSGGRMGWAVRAAQDGSMLDERNDFLNLLETAIAGSRVQRFALAESLSKDKTALQTALGIWQTYWRDVLLLAYSTTTPTMNRDRRHTMQQVAVNTKVDDIYRVLQSIQRTGRYVMQNVNPRLALETLMLDLPYVRLLAAPPGA